MASTPTKATKFYNIASIYSTQSELASYAYLKQISTGLSNLNTAICGRSYINSGKPQHTNHLTHQKNFNPTINQGEP